MLTIVQITPLPMINTTTSLSVPSPISTTAANIPKNEVLYVKEKLRIIHQSMAEPNKSVAIRALNRISHKRCHLCLIKHGDVLPNGNQTANCGDICRQNDIQKHSVWCCNQDAVEYDRPQFMPIFLCSKLAQ